MAFERVIAVLCTFENMKLSENPSLFGDIFENIYRWGYTMDEYLKEETHKYKAIKVFTHRE